MNECPNPPVTTRKLAEGLINRVDNDLFPNLIGNMIHFKPPAVAASWIYDWVVIRYAGHRASIPPHEGDVLALGFKLAFLAWVEYRKEFQGKAGN